jgi:hypothetical protein
MRPGKGPAARVARDWNAPSPWAGVPATLLRRSQRQATYGGSMENEKKMTMLATAQREAVAAALREKGATNPCVRCNHCEFTFAESMVSVQGTAPSGHLGNYGIRSVAVICTNCGHLALHDADYLGV